MKASIKLLTLALLVSCSNPEPSFDIIKGKWKVEGYEMFEIWEDSDEAILKGHSFFVEEGDTTHLELMMIQADEEDGFDLNVVVMMQNEAREISFKLTQLTPEIIRFENPEHDMPQVVQYSQAGVDTLDIYLSGHVEASDEEKVKNYTFVKQK
jgi:hypothetical protein